MPTLNVSVVDKIATGDGQIIVCDNTDYTVKFNLDAEWGEYNAKTMRVIYPDNNYEDTLFTGDECPLPRLYNVNSIRIGIYAGDLHATAVAVFGCRKSVLSEEGQHVQPPEDIYNQIMDAIENGALDGVGIDHIDKTATAGLVDTYTIYYTDETTSTFEVTNGSSIASVAKTSTSGNVDTYTITYDNGETTTFEVTNGAVTSVDGMTGDIVLDNKANIDGSYDGMTVGSAQQLLASSGVEDKAPYAYRTSGGSMDIGDRKELNEINGMTLVVNQLVDTNTSSVTITSGNKYYAKIGGTASIAQSNGSAVAVTGGTDYVVDLTQLFGFATIADYVYSLEQSQSGAGVAWLRSHNIPLDIPYTAPTLMSVKTTGHKTVGFNQFDEETVLPTTGAVKQADGSWYWATGTTANDKRVWTNTLGYTGQICITATVKYSSSVASERGVVFRVYYTDGTNEYKSPTAGLEWLTGSLLTKANKVVDRIQLTYAKSSTSTWMKNICINLSWSGTRNGEYEAYVEHTYPLDSTLELRGIPKLDSNNKLYADGDIYAPSGDVTRRYGIVDLGSLTWVMSTVTDHNRFQANNLHALVKFATDNIICAKYLLSSTHSASFVADKVIVTSGSTQDNGRLWIWDDEYSTAADFKTAMSGVYLVYELATPTTETADPYQQTQVVNDLGTEEFIDSRDIAIPVGHKTTYLPNLRDKLQHLPSLASDDGYYLISQQDNTMSLELFRIPKAPSEDGTYQLKATVTGGTPTYFWEAIV